MGLEHCPGGCKGMGGGNTPRAQILRRDDEEEDEDGEEGEVTQAPHSLPSEDLPRLVTSSAGKRGSLSVRAGRHNLRWGLCLQLARHNNLALHWYLLTYRV
jgi:hypothetical protein